MSRPGSLAEQFFMKTFDVSKDGNGVVTKDFIGRAVSVNGDNQTVVILYTDGDKETLSFEEARKFLLDDSDTDMILFARSEWNEAVEAGTVKNDCLGPFSDVQGKLPIDGKINQNGGEIDIKKAAVPKKTIETKNQPTLPRNPYHQSFIAHQATAEQRLLSNTPGLKPDASFFDQGDLAMSNHMFNQNDVPDKLNVDNFKKNAKRSNSSPMRYYVSHPFTANNGDVFYMIIAKPPFALWYVGSDLLKDIFTSLYGDNAPAFMLTLKDCPERKNQFGSNEVSRNKPKDGGKGYPKTCITFVYAFTKAEHVQYKGIAIENAFQKIKYALSTVQNIADAIHCWLEENQNGIITHWNGKGLDTAEIIKNINNDIQASFKKKQEVFYNQSLDKYLLDWEIKSFFTDVVGIDDWPSYHGEGMQRVFSRYPSKPAPRFDSIREPNLNDL